MPLYASRSTATISSSQIRSLVRTGTTIVGCKCAAGGRRVAPTETERDLETGPFAPERRALSAVMRVCKGQSQVGHEASGIPTRVHHLKEAADIFLRE